MICVLRDYQTNARDAIDIAFEQHRRVLCVLPTGMGKTELFVAVANDWNIGRVLVVAPQLQLIGQAAKKIYQRTGVMPAIEQASEWSNESPWARNQYVVGSKQTLTGKNKRYQRFQEVGLLIVDEAHLFSKLLADMIDWFVERGAKVLAVTATPKRHDGKAMANIVDTCAYEMYLRDAIDLGWLVAPRAHCAQLESLDLSEVGTKGSKGDFKDGELAKAMEDEKVICEVAEITASESVGLKTVVYCASVNEARRVAHRLVDTHHLKADWVCGDVAKCSEDYRKRVLDSFTEDPDGVQIVCNVGVLTTGWDFPGLEHIVMARPTRSLALFTQIMGRGTRPLPGVVDFPGSTAETRKAAIAASRKPHFKVTDLRDNSLKHKLISTVDVLGGEMGLEVVKRAKKAMEKAGGAIDVNEALEIARLELEEKERKRLAKLKAKADYRRTEADLFGGHAEAEPVSGRMRTARMTFGKHKGKPLDQVPHGYIRWAIENKIGPNWLRNSMRSELYFRSGRAAAPVVQPDAFKESITALLEGF